MFVPSARVRALLNLPSLPTEGEAGDVDQDLTGDKAYEYNHVTVTGLEVASLVVPFTVHAD